MVGCTVLAVPVTESKFMEIKVGCGERKILAVVERCVGIKCLKLRTE